MRKTLGGRILWLKKEYIEIKLGHKKGDLLRLATGKRQSGYGLIII
jgi:hypothetical protein